MSNGTKLSYRHLDKPLGSSNRQMCSLHSVSCNELVVTLYFPIYIYSLHLIFSPPVNEAFVWAIF